MIERMSNVPDNVIAFKLFGNDQLDEALSWVTEPMGKPSPN